jgi:hypothetical protein
VDILIGGRDGCGRTLIDNQVSHER